ncbi:hypothetical protein EYF80_039910 [Liparis tanakae]|uniref:Uncharacterized protein n=1 Tax=Liparis tanakae TaxID=230148 RepID=A0A4Z2G8P5_9TELE|nr:hypothetical protein EYF80_039910 [Liparis tanakae]
MLLMMLQEMDSGKSPHAKGTKRGVKGAEFPLDLLLDAPKKEALFFPLHVQLFTKVLSQWKTQQVDN